MAKKHSPRFLEIAEAARVGVREIAADVVRGRLGSGEHVVLVDVREDHEWTSGHIADAVHLGKGIIERDIEKLYPDPATPLILYCGGGFRSAMAADALTRMGYTNVESMIGGFSGWKDAGFDVVTPDP